MIYKLILMKSLLDGVCWMMRLTCQRSLLALCAFMLYKPSACLACFTCLRAFVPCLTHQKQPWRSVLMKSCPENMRVAVQLIEITLRHGCSPVNLLHCFWALFPKNTSGGLLLTLHALRTLFDFVTWLDLWLIQFFNFLFWQNQYISQWLNM